jgi:hypothetical protein
VKKLQRVKNMRKKELEKLNSTGRKWKWFNHCQLPAQLLIPCRRFQNNRMIANKSHNIFQEKSIQAKEPIETAKELHWDRTNVKEIISTLNSNRKPTGYPRAAAMLSSLKEGKNKAMRQINIFSLSWSLLSQEIIIKTLSYKFLKVRVEKK